MASSSRKIILGDSSAAHTEYSRLLAEHGSGGALALLTLLFILWKVYWRAPDFFARAWAASMAAWSLVELGHAAMRIAAISFIFGLACIRWQEHQSGNEKKNLPLNSSTKLSQLK
jgi:hypothetical protein